MADLREALLKAAANGKDNPLAGQIQTSARKAGHAEAQERKIEALGRRFNTLGNAQYQIMMNPSYRGERDPNVLNSQWTALQPEFVAANQNQRKRILTAFAEGLRVTGENMSPRYQEYFDLKRNFRGLDLEAAAIRFGFVPNAWLFLRSLSIYQNMGPIAFDRFQTQIRGDATQPLTLSQTIDKIAEFLPTQTNAPEAQPPTPSR